MVGMSRWSESKSAIEVRSNPIQRTAAKAGTDNAKQAKTMTTMLASPHPSDRGIRLSGRGVGWAERVGREDVRTAESRAWIISPTEAKRLDGSSSSARWRTSLTFGGSWICGWPGSATELPACDLKSAADFSASWTRRTDKSSKARTAREY